jgi:hypothetical protein
VIVSFEGMITGGGLLTPPKSGLILHSMIGACAAGAGMLSCANAAKLLPDNGDDDDRQDIAG